jgi:DNA-binding winged helix-turn-helix (wHTH) protein/Tol biopolymer transport system component
VIYRFGGFELEPERRSLRSIATAEPVALTAKLFDLLVYLIEHRGRLVEKQELLDAVWPNVIVEEANLPQTISVLRRALGEDPRAHEYIATIPGRGYQFVATVEIAEPQSGTIASEPDAGLILHGTSGALERSLDATPRAAAARAARQRAYLLAAGLVGAVLAGSLVFALTRPAPQPRSVSRYFVTPPATAPLSSLGGVDLEISPDGTRLAYFSHDAQTEGITLYLRDLAELDARVVPGSEGMDPGGEQGHPFFSNDSKWIGFWSPDQGIMRVPVTGGPALKMLDGPTGFFGAAWVDDTLIFSSGYGVFRTSARGGGTPELLTGATGPGGTFYVAPRLLPGARAVLLTLIEGNSERVAVLDLETHERRILNDDGQNASYAATGHIVFARGTTLFAQPFDVERLVVTGEPVALLHGVRNPGANTAADYALSATGTLAYVPAGAAATGTPIWVDRSGRIGEHAVGEPLESPREPRLSPDGLRLVLTTGPFDDGDLWIYDLGGRLPILLTEAGDNRLATWSPDGAQIAFTSNRGGSYDVYTAPTDGSVAAPLPLRSHGLNAAPAVWSAEGDLILTRGGPSNSVDIVATRVESDSEVREVATTSYSESNAALSPNGRWLAFASDRTGRPEVWVKRYPDGVPVRVSRDGGVEPRWSGDGQELFYLQGNAMMAAAVAVEANAELSFRAAVGLFTEPSLYRDPSVSSHTYDVGRDGRFLMIHQSRSTTDAAGSSSIVVVENWLEELQQRVPQ